MAATPIMMRLVARGVTPLRRLAALSGVVRSTVTPVDAGASESPGRQPITGNLNKELEVII